MDVASRINQLKQEAEQLKAKIREKKEQAADTTLGNVTSSCAPVALPKIAPRRVLKGHMGKIYAMGTAAEGTHVVSAGQDGVLIVWEGLSAHKTHAIPLRSAWVMSTCMAPSGNYVASGGMDNFVTVFNLNCQDTPIPPCREMEGHGAQVTDMSFVSDSKLLSSGDERCLLWDIENNKIITEFSGHLGDVNCLSLSPDKNTFVSGSVDATARLFDIRDGKQSQLTFDAPESDVMAVEYMPTGNAFATGEDKDAARLFDLRAGVCLSTYRVDRRAGVTSVAFTKSGRVMFTAYEDDGAAKHGGGIIRVWDTLKGNQLQEFKAHKECHISTIAVTGDGRALATASWDTTVKIFS